MDPRVRRLTRAQYPARDAPDRSALPRRGAVLLAGCGDGGDEPRSARRPVESPSEVLGDADEGIEGVQAFRVYYPTGHGPHRDGDVDYELQPSGRRDARPRCWWNCGFYDEPVPDENAVHTLEHGAVWLAYAPDLADADVEVIHDLARAERRRCWPRPTRTWTTGVAVVATAWARQLALDSVDDPRLAEFVDAVPGRRAGTRSRACPARRDARRADPLGQTDRRCASASSRAGSPKTSKRSSTGTRFHAHSSRSLAVPRSATSPLAWPCSKVTPLGAEGHQPLAVDVGGVEVDRAVAAAGASAGREGAKSSRCSSMPSTASAGSIAPPAASQRCTAVSWAIRRG